jgi:hypothetical protein
MGQKKHRLTVGLDMDDLKFLRDTGVFKSDNEGIRFAVKFLRLYGLPAIKNVRETIK